MSAASAAASMAAPRAVCRVKSAAPASSTAAAHPLSSRTASRGTGVPSAAAANKHGHVLARRNRQRGAAVDGEQNPPHTNTIPVTSPRFHLPSRRSNEAPTGDASVPHSPGRSHRHSHSPPPPLSSRDKKKKSLDFCTTSSSVKERGPFGGWFCGHSFGTIFFF